MDGRPNRRTEAAFSNVSGVAWTGTEYTASCCHLTFIFQREFLRFRNFWIYSRSYVSEMELPTSSI